MTNCDCVWKNKILRASLDKIAEFVLSRKIVLQRVYQSAVNEICELLHRYLFIVTYLHVIIEKSDYIKKFDYDAESPRTFVPLH